MYLPVGRRVVSLGAVEILHPDLGSVRHQHFFDHPMAPARANHVKAHLVILEDPFPLVLPLHSGPGCVTTNQPAPTQPLESPTPWLHQIFFRGSRRTWMTQKEIGNNHPSKLIFQVTLLGRFLETTLTATREKVVSL